MDHRQPALVGARALPDTTQPSIGRRFMLSLQAADSPRFPTSGFRRWFAERRKRAFTVSRIPFAELDQWYFEADGGNLRHRTGRFFSIEGLRLEDGDRSGPDPARPIIVQPEIGTLGILVKEFDGILHCLMQAKMEPGNIGSVQLSPTVQATRSNYRRAHGGSRVRYLEHFTRPGHPEVLVDLLQSEHGSYFLHKRNRHMVVETTADVPEHEDFHWLTLGQISRLLRQEHVVNMDARTVLSCIPLEPAAGPDGAGFPDAVLHSLGPQAAPRHSDAELTGWLTSARAGADGSVRRVPLTATEADGWIRGPGSITRRGGADFAVIAVRAEADNREVPSWTQPLVELTGPAVHAFIARRLDGMLHVLVRASAERGSLNGPELAPTVQCPPGGTARYLDQVLQAPPDRVHFDVAQSEEGGRFHLARTRNLIVEAEDGFPVDQPEEYRWMTLDQLARMTRLGQHVNIQARTLLACAPSVW
ncbi:NDP-hexose 2,3-dehydratase family protein [Kitasatospora cystarginea]|uniref:NDP-hexose 2,3-dehydratase family protein n=1 Tax=Kitasatospora cystarginea TaxID=58350 RepID=A0ABP5RMR8_9ACTN